MRKAIRTSVLMLALTCVTYAGDIPNGTPEPPKINTVSEPTTNGEIPNPPETEDTTTQIALSILQSVLSLL